jgi:hypothetical protein
MNCNSCQLSLRYGICLSNKVALSAFRLSLKPLILYIAEVRTISDPVLLKFEQNLLLSNLNEQRSTTSNMNNLNAIVRIIILL